MGEVLYFETEVKEKIKLYNTINFIVLILSYIGGLAIATYLSTTTVYDSTGFYSRGTEIDKGMLFSIFGGLALSSTLFFAVIRVVIKIYGEKVRANLYNHLMLDKLIDISVK